jgi:hypothetical protein
MTWRLILPELRARQLDNSFDASVNAFIDGVRAGARLACCASGRGLKAASRGTGLTRRVGRIRGRFRDDIQSQ